MKSKHRNRQREKLVQQIQNLAAAKVNDAVKLAYLSPDQVDVIDGLDLTALTEFKRSGNGAVEIKFNNRMIALEKLLELTQASEEGGLAALLNAINEPEQE